MTARRVLIIDDHDFLRFSLRSILERQGHVVEEADDGLDGVRKALLWKPDVVVVDMDMPLLDGYGVARHLRQTLGKEVRLIALTGHDEPQRAHAAGFDVHVLKPMAPEQLCSCLSNSDMVVPICSASG
jgi:two-component system, sensor histidine kinase